MLIPISVLVLELLALIRVLILIFIQTVILQGLYNYLAIESATNRNANLDLHSVNDSNYGTTNEYTNATNIVSHRTTTYHDIHTTTSTHTYTSTTKTISVYNGVRTYYGCYSY